MTDAAEYIESAIRAAVPGLPVRPVRFENAAEARGPSVLWRQTGREDHGLLDAGRGNPVYLIECRSPTYSGAAFIARAVLDKLISDGAIARIVDEGDAPAGPSSLRAGYYAAELAVEIGTVPAAMPA